MAHRKQRGIAGDKTICLPIADDIDYAKVVAERESYRAYLNGQIAQHPQLFSTGDSGGLSVSWVDRIAATGGESAPYLSPEDGRSLSIAARLCHTLYERNGRNCRESVVFEASWHFL
jgi:hypothetical protein